MILRFWYGINKFEPITKSYRFQWFVANLHIPLKFLIEDDCVVGIENLAYETWEQQHQTTRSNSSRIAPINTFTVDSCSLFGPRSLMKFVWEFMIIFISKHKLCRDNYALWNLVEKTMWVSTPDQVFVWCSHYYNKVFQWRLNWSFTMIFNCCYSQKVNFN